MIMMMTMKNNNNDDDDIEKYNAKNTTTTATTSWLWANLDLFGVVGRRIGQGRRAQPPASSTTSTTTTPVAGQQQQQHHYAATTTNTTKVVGQQLVELELKQLLRLPVLRKVAMKLSCCACCCFYPKYKRKVDNIYPRRQVDAPLVKNEVDKLQYYVTVHPEKLAKIGECLYHNLKRGLNGAHKNRNYVKNTIEAVEKILLVITPQNLNYFAPYYLKIIQKLLEQSGSSSSASSATATLAHGANSKGMGGTISSNNIAASQAAAAAASNNTDGLEYQKMAASLFQKFCDKEASNLSSTVNYQLNFDQFVCQFSAMCYNTNKEERIRAEVRSSGLQCLATMVKRLVPDDNLRAGYIWDNMDKIVPALLFIMHESFLVQHPLLARLGQLNENERDKMIEAGWLTVAADTAAQAADSDEFNKYLYASDDYYGGRKINGGASNNGFNGAPNSNEIARPDSVKIHFTKSSSQLADSQGNSPEESNVMIATNNWSNAGNNNQQSQQVIDPEHEAKLLLKSIASKADYTTIGKIVMPILAFLDDNKPRGWELAQFVRCIFLIVMYNVKQQHAIVIKELIKHIDSHRNSSALLKCYILRTINVCIGIAAMQSVGTTGQIIEIFTNLLKHLNYSVEKAFNLKAQLIGNKSASTQNLKDFNKINQELNEEQKLQKEIIKSMGQFTSNLPDYAKNDVFMFIARQINSQQFNYADLALSQADQQQQSSAPNSKEQQLRSKYFECLYEICTRYRPSQLFSAFTSGQFLDDILRLTLVNDWASRLKAHEILHLLLDKYQLLDKIKSIKPSLFSTDLVARSDADSSIRKSLNNLASTRNQTYLSQLELNTNALNTSREDMHFMRKNGRAFLAHLNESLFLTNNRRENFESIYLTSALFLIGLFNEKEFLGDLIRFGFHVQELALLNHDDAQFSFVAQCNVHKFVCAYFLLLSKSSGFEEFEKYTSAMCDLRRRRELFKFVYPEYLLLDSATGVMDSASITTTTSGVSSAGTTLGEMETEFKRELAQSAKEYMQMVKKEDSGSGVVGDGASSTSDAATMPARSQAKLAAWLFDKQIVDDLLKQSSYPTTSLYVKSSDFSLSVNYLQQTMATIQTSLRYRSPYSCSYDSLVAINSNLPVIDLVNQNAIGGGGSKTVQSKGYTGGLGLSTSMNQFNTPRRSIDADSNGDGDDTSYDSTSQLSVDYDMLQQLPTAANGLVGNNRLFFLEPGAASSSQQPVSQQQQQLQVNATLGSFRHQQFGQDLTSFETIKRVLFNGNGINGGLSSNNSAAGGQTSSLLRTSGASSSVGGSKLLKGIGESASSAAVVAAASAIIGSSEDQSETANSSAAAAYEAETSMRIISEFKQKPFDELKQTLIKTNQSYVNTDKYQQVLDLISREIQQQSGGEASTSTMAAGGIGGSSGGGSGVGVGIGGANTAAVASSASTTAAATNATATSSGVVGGAGGAGSYTNISLSNLKNTSISSMSSNQSASMGSNNILLNGRDPTVANTTGSNAQKTIPLNDIDFPKLFMF